MSLCAAKCPSCGAAVQPIPGRPAVYCTQCGSRVALEEPANGGVRQTTRPPVPTQPAVQQAPAENFEAQRFEILRRYERLTRLVIICFSSLFLVLCGMQFWLEAFGHVYSSWIVFIAISVSLLVVIGIAACSRFRKGKERELSDLIRRQEEARGRSDH